jgi:hypothetical protein
LSDAAFVLRNAYRQQQRTERKAGTDKSPNGFLAWLILRESRIETNTYAPESYAFYLHSVYELAKGCGPLDSAVTIQLIERRSRIVEYLFELILAAPRMLLLFLREHVTDNLLSSDFVLIVLESNAYVFPIERSRSDPVPYQRFDDQMVGLDAPARREEPPAEIK